MLYREPAQGWRKLWLRLSRRRVGGVPAQRFADLDLLSMSGHLRRDLGLGDDVLPK